jgi:hypothetical protein
MPTLALVDGNDGNNNLLIVLIGRKWDTTGPERRKSGRKWP